MRDSSAPSFFGGKCALGIDKSDLLYTSFATIKIGKAETVTPHIPGHLKKGIKAKEGRMMKQQQRRVGEGVPFERIRRITGYLVGTLDRWGNAKRAEERDRVPHNLK